VPPQIPSWGNVLAEGRLHLQQAPGSPSSRGPPSWAASSGWISSATGCATCSNPRCRASAARPRP